MISAFSISMVIFEFPTGVLADRFSHKKSVVWGGFLGAIFQFAYIIPAGFYFYLTIFVLVGLSSSMNSGSNTAMLHKISDNFQRDLSRIRTIGLLWIAGTTLLGGWLFTVNITLPYILNGGSLLLAGVIFSTIKIPENAKVRGDKSVRVDNVYKIALSSLEYLKHHKKLKGITLLSGTFLAIFFSHKYIFPTLFEIRNIPVTQLSVVMSLGGLFLALGTFLASTRYYIRLKYSISLLLLSILFLGFVKSIFVLAGVIFVIHFLRGMFVIRTTVLINDYSEDSIRASILSLRSLFSRIFMAGYMLLVGKVLALYSPEMLSVITFGILSIFVLYFIWTVTSRK